MKDGRSGTRDAGRIWNHRHPRLLSVMTLSNDSLPTPSTASVRVTLSLPTMVAQQLDDLVSRGIHTNRSQAVAKLLAGALVSSATADHRVLAGTVTLTYSHAKRGVETTLTRIQHRYLKEVVSTQRVHLAHGNTLEVVLLQAPGPILQQIADELLACKGVTHGQLYICSEVLPPLHG
jgi:CopG family transcriptional regulator, nickel-responsive regulator